MVFTFTNVSSLIPLLSNFSGHLQADASTTLKYTLIRYGVFWLIFTQQGKHYTLKCLKIMEAIHLENMTIFCRVFKNKVDLRTNYKQLIFVYDTEVILSPSRLIV